MPRVLLAARVLAGALLLSLALLGWMAEGPVLAASFAAWWSPRTPVVPAAPVLAGLVVAVDPGHGGYDDGVLVNKGRPDEIREADINLAVSLKLQDLLERAGAVVVLTRTGDFDLVQPGDAERYGSSIRADLTRRAELANQAGADVFLSIHCNSFPAARWRGAQTFYLTSSGAPSRLLAEAIQAELVRVTGETEREANGREGIYVLRLAKMPAATVELGFLSNPRDLALLANPDYQHLLALAVLFGVCRFARLVPAWDEGPGVRPQ